MELSELVNFNNKLYACDDRTGIIFEVQNKKFVIPTFILTNGDGTVEKGFKCEWMTVKDNKLVVGSMGKEFIRDGVIVNDDAEWVKFIDTEGHIKHVSWIDNYKTLRKFSGASFPGYLLHEAVNWNPKTHQWVFLPRRFSDDPYDEVVDETKGTNLVLMASEDFSHITKKTIGELDPIRGVSSFKFIPFRESEVLVLKSIEYKEQIISYVTVYNLDTGEVHLEDTKVDDKKYEGIEII